jgi:hypothetical protein
MPYTLPLRPMPSFPSAQGKIVNADGTPSKEMMTLLRDLEECLRSYRAALDEIEAVTFP